MAAIRVYGHKGCPLTAETVEWLESCGANVLTVDVGEQMPSPAVQARLAAFAEPGGFSAGAPSLHEDAPAGDEPQAIPIVVRGERVVLAGDPARIASLIY